MSRRALFHRDGPAEVFGLDPADALPTEIHGFRVEFRLGPHPKPTKRYPMAFFTRLLPADADVAAKMWRAGKQEITVTTPLSKPGAALIRMAPDGQLAENVATLALAEAWRLARIVADA